MSSEEKTQKKRGPIPGPKTTKYTILMEEELGEWGKRQPGGLSETARRLFRQEFDRISREGGAE